MSYLKQHLSHILSRQSTVRLSPIILCAFLLRLFLLEAQSIWWDEAISLHLATSTVADLLADRAAHIHPPLYFLLLKGWITLAGTSAFSVRFFSVWFNTLLVPVSYAFGRRWLDRPTGLLTSFLVAISPLYIVYSQETRVYAVLPLIYLAILALVNHLTLAKRPIARHYWLLLVGIEVAGLHLHYVVLLVVAYANLLILSHLWRRPRELTRWLISVTLVALLCLPWAIATFYNREAVLSDVGVGDPFADPLPWFFFIRLLWDFQWSGLTAAPGYALLHTAALALAALFLAALALLLTNARTRATVLRLLAHWLVPLLPAILMWQAKPLSHPRYVAIFAVALFILVGYLLVQLRHHRAGGQALTVLLGLTLLITSSLALHAWYFIPRFSKDDVRGLGAWLEAKTSIDDLIIAPWQDWSLDYAYRGDSPIIRPNPADESATWDALTSQTTTTRRILLVSYPRANQDRRGLIPFALETTGARTESQSFKGLRVHMYTLDGPVERPPKLAPANAYFGSLRLAGAWVESSPAADTALTVALRWRLEEHTSDRYRVGLRLRDMDGWELAAKDDWLLDDRALPSDRWATGQAATTYHVLPLVPGTPPLTYTLSLGVYTTDVEGVVHPLDLLDEAGNPRGQSHRLGAVELAPARGLDNDLYGIAPDIPTFSEPAILADGLLLKAAALDRQAVAPGQSVFVTLRWQAADAPLPDLRPVVRLEQAGDTLATADNAPAGGRYPTDRWQAGEVVLEHRRLTVPPTAADGPAAVAVELGDRRVALGNVEIATGEHTFAAPPMAHELHVRFGGSSGAPGQTVAELLGYDLAPGPYTSDRSISLTLYWRACEGSADGDYTVFTHLLAGDGHLVAQHDGLPAGGSRPTLGWIPGEIVVDRHEITFRETYAGPARIEVGLYDTITLERVPAENGQTFALLPAVLNILEH